MAATGTPDLGGGPEPLGPARSVATLTGPATGAPDVAVTLTARREGTRYTIEGRSPGPEIRAVEGQLVQVRLVNESVPGGVTLHWHGLDVPNAEDGVAGVTQDAVPVGGAHVYRFVAGTARHLLVPLAPGLPRAGAARPVRAARRRPAGRARRDGRGDGDPARLRRRPHDRWRRGRARRPRRGRRDPAAARAQHRQRRHRGLDRRRPVRGRRRRRHGRARAGAGAGHGRAGHRGWPGRPAAHGAARRDPAGDRHGGAGDRARRVARRPRRRARPGSWTC